MEEFDDSYVKNEVTGCWHWIGKKDSAGYGLIKGKPAHRISYERSKGEIPNRHMVRHLCHNKACVNPDHLELGTAIDNMQDRLDITKPGRRAGIEAKIEKAKLTGNGVLCNFRLSLSALESIRDIMEVTNLSDMTKAVEILIAATKK